MSKTKKITLITLSMTLALIISGVTYYIYRNSPKGIVMPLILTDGHPGMTREEIARHMVDRANSYVNYISRCKRFPDNIEDMYHKRFFDSDNCKPFRMRSINTFIDTKDNVRPWIDPWGRPYQIRYDRERRKLQVRSQGNNLSIKSDDIQDETFFDGKSYKTQVEYCKTVPNDDMSCIFNRGWH